MAMNEFLYYYLNMNMILQCPLDQVARVVLAHSKTSGK